MKNNKETLELKNLTADVKKKNAEASQHTAESKKLRGRLDVDKAEELRFILNAHVIDESRTVMGSEPIYTTTINGKNRDIIIKKLMEIIERF